MPGLKIHYEALKIPAVSTHNTISPFNMEMNGGIEVEIHVIKIIGSEKGPTVYVGGGTHGDEINGIEAVLRLPSLLDKIDIKGTLILVPLQNPAAYKFRARLNPYDPIDPDWVHPGDPKGKYTQRMKYHLRNLWINSDCIIDLHTSGRKGSNNSMIYVPPENGNGSGNESLRLSKAFGGDRIIFGSKEENYGWPVKNAMPFVAVRNGKAGLYPEAGNGGSSIPKERHVKYFTTGVMNVLKKMGLITGDIVKQGEVLVVDPLEEKNIFLKARIEGIFNPTVEVGEKVRKGQLLAEIHAIPKGIQKIISPMEGLVTYRHFLGPTTTGENLYTISQDIEEIS